MFMYMGELIEYDRTDKMFDNPTDERTRAYLTGKMVKESIPPSLILLNGYRIPNVEKVFSDICTHIPCSNA